MTIPILPTQSVRSPETGCDEQGEASSHGSPAKVLKFVLPAKECTDAPDPLLLNVEDTETWIRLCSRTQVLRERFAPYIEQIREIQRKADKELGPNARPWR